MCGIAGIFSPSRSTGRREVQQMVNHLHHRGPDSQGIFQCETTCLGAVRLAIQDLGESGNQPITSPKGEWTIVFNGEIFNHHILRNQLSDIRWKGNSDTETFAAGFEAYGPQFLEQCDGFFAFAAYQHSTGELVLGRDRFGIKPLYFGKAKSDIWFCSETLPMIQAGFPAQLNQKVLHASMYHYWVNGCETPVQNIQRVLQGHLIRIFPNGSIKTERWHHLKDWVIKPVLCSGGLDSSLITSIASKISKTPLIAFSATFPDQPDADERAYAEMVCRHSNAEYIPVEFDTDSFKFRLIECTAHYGYPLLHENPVALAQIAEKARSLGIKALLSGEAADELFGGYNSRSISYRQDFIGDEYIAPKSRKHPWKAHFPEVTTQASKKFEDYNFNLMLNSYASNASPSNRSKLEAGIASDLYHFLSHGLNRLDKNMMQHSVEIREPFLQADLVKFAMNLPLEYRIFPKLKGILRDVGLRHLPEVIIHRKKIGFNFNVTDALKSVKPDFLRNGYLREYLEIPQSEWTVICSLLDGRSLLRFVSGEIWCRIYLQNQKKEDLLELV